MSESEPLPAVMARFQRLLVLQHLKARDSMAPGMMPDGVAPTVENVQVNLVILQRRDLRSEFAGQTFASQGDMWRVEHVFRMAASSFEAVELESLFSSAPQHAESKESTVGVLAVASAGCGKTFTFTLLAPWKWAKKELWPEFDIVVARKLRSKKVREAEGVGELLGLNFYDITDARDRQAVCDFVREHPERVCLILDGLDETSLADCSEFVREVIEGQTLQGIRLILTSRPCTDVFKLSESRVFQHRVELIGFRADDVKAYVRKVLRAEEAAALLAEVEKDDQLSSMMATPFIAKETCRLYHSDKFVPRCVADMFERMIIQVAERRSGEVYKHWGEIPVELQALILDLGGFAFNMLIEQRLVFTEANIQKYKIGREAIALGLLVACDPSASDTDKHWRFSHLTMQENLAAKYQACCKPMPLSRIVRLVESFGALSGHLRTFWVLLAAQLDTAGAECLVNSLMTRKKVRDWRIGDMDDSEFHVSDPFPMNFIGPLCEVIDDAKMFHLAEALLCDVVAGGRGQELVEGKMRHSRVTRISNVEFLKTLLLTWCALVKDANKQLLLAGIAEVSESLASHCRSCLSDQEREAKSGEISLGDVDFDRNEEHRERRMVAFQCFAEHALHRQGRECSPLPSIAASLRHETGEVLIDGDRHPSECRTTGTVVQYHSDAVSSVYIRSFSPAGNCQLPTSLQQCSAITHLTVMFCEGQWAAVNAMIQRSSSTLQSVSADRSAITDVDMSLLASPLCACTSLSKLRLESCDLSPAIAPVLCTAVQHWPRLKVLNLRNNPRLGGESFSQLCVPLANCAMLAELGIENCGLSAQSLSALGMAVHHWPHLEILGLTDNPGLGDEAVGQLCIALAECPMIKRLFLAGLGLASQSLSTLGMAVHHWPHLQHVDLDNNPGLVDEAVGQLCIALTECTMMKYLWLSVCGLSSQVLPSLTSAIRHWSRLDTLYLHGNDFHDITAEQADQFIEAINSVDKEGFHLLLPALRANASADQKRLTDRSSYRSGIRVFAY